MEFQKWREPALGKGGSAPFQAAGAGDEADARRAGATLVVSTRPPAEVTVRIAGRVRRGRTPLTLAALEPGGHELVVERRGYRTHRETVSLRAGERVERLIPLRDELGLWYRDHLVFPRMRVEVYDDEIDGQVVGVFGRLENRGDRLVHRVQLRLRFLDPEGRSRHEEYVHPLLAGGGTRDQPLAPGGAQDFAVKAARVPIHLCCENVDWQVTFIDAR
jgi:hypothetical protein